MYFNFTIRLLELEGVSSKQTNLGVVEQVITENDNYQQVARENCGGVIVMKLEITQLRCEDIVTYNISYKVSRKLARFDEPQEYTVNGLLWDYCKLLRVSVMY